MNGAQSLMGTLVNGDVTVCFMNPGTSEMHFVAALDSTPAMRGVLCLFEGVATGAADGYARMTGRPAATLLHLGPGLGNGLANLHNARRAHSPLVNIVGDHATYHRQYNAPLTMDIEAVAGAVSGWVRSADSPDTVAADGAAAIVAARTPPGQVATLILPGDAAWNPAPGPVDVPPPPGPQPPDLDRVREAAQVLRRGEPTVLYLGGDQIKEPQLRWAGRIAQATGARLVGERAASRAERGAGRPIVQRLPYPVDQATAMLAGARHLILVGAQPPVAFFAYPDKPSLLAPPDCQLHTLAEIEEDCIQALAMLADELDAPEEVGPVYALERPALPSGAIDADKVWLALSALMPEQAIIADESITSGRAAGELTAGAPPHDWLHVTGGSIGQGLPVATGAAIACPDRQVFAMEADGSAMYTLQALWTQAREGLNVVTVLFANRKYRILQGELRRVKANEPGPRAQQMLSLDQPAIDWVGLARGMGVPAGVADTAEAFLAQLQAGIHEPGPRLIQVNL